MERHEPRITPGLSLVGGTERRRGFHPPAGILGHATAAAAVEAGTALGLPAALAFTMVEVIVRHPDGRIARASGSLGEIADWAPAAGWLDALSRPRRPFAGLALDRPAIMGIVNVTPDSFSDGGTPRTPRPPSPAGVALATDGADIVDVGGESTRPGAAPYRRTEEHPPRRAGRRARWPLSGAVVSVDTRNAAVMRAALDAGARIINDVRGWRTTRAPRVAPPAAARSS